MSSYKKHIKELLIFNQDYLFKALTILKSIRDNSYNLVKRLRPSDVWMVWRQPYNG